MSDTDGMTDRELLVRIDERLAALQGHLEALDRRLSDLEARQRQLNGAQRAATVKDEEFQAFVCEMRAFKEDLLEWKGGVAKQVGLIGLIGGAIPSATVLLVLVLRGVL